jgi:spermidine dehydrogenase
MAVLFVQDRSTYYPPALTGMRGSHDGSWELAHAPRDGRFWQQAGAITDTPETYDLIVVGCGIDGLAAVYFFRQQVGNDARLLLLDNHDDCGGDATRNEFSAGGGLLLGNGGTHSIATPTPYSLQARGLLTALGIDPPALTAQCLEQQLFAALRPMVFFNRQTFGEDRLVSRDPTRPWKECLGRTPLSQAAQRDIKRIQEAPLGYPCQGCRQRPKKLVCRASATGTSCCRSSRRILMSSRSTRRARMGSTESGSTPCRPLIAGGLECLAFRT